MNTGLNAAHRALLFFTVFTHTLSPLIESRSENAFRAVSSLGRVELRSRYEQRCFYTFHQSGRSHDSGLRTLFAAEDGMNGIQVRDSYACRTGWWIKSRTSENSIFIFRINDHAYPNRAPGHGRIPTVAVIKKAMSKSC